MSLADTLRRLPPAAVDFARSLFDHHWLEASWLYERRDVLHSQGALLSADGWLELETRTDAHVAALAKGGALVLDECEAKALEGDVGELHTAVRVLARTDEIDRFNALLERIDWGDPARAWAVTDALAWDAPDAWQELVSAALADESMPQDALGPLARVVGLRGWPQGEILLGVLEDRVGDLEAICWALGVLGVQDALSSLYEVIQEDLAPPVKQAAAIAALRFAAGEVVAFLEQVVGTQAWAAVPLALGGGPTSWGALSKAAKATPTAEHMWAIGLFGYVGGIELLLEFVEDETCGEAAAEGLYLLTGADLYEEGYEKNPDAEPSGEGEEDEPLGLLVCRLPRSREAWEGWLDEHDGERLRGRIGTRVRGGAAFEPGTVLDEVGRRKVGARVGGWMLEELDVRYRLKAAMWPRQQEKARRTELGMAQAELPSRPKIMAGEWYLAGQPLRVATPSFHHVHLNRNGIT
ncbi:MAG: hypothetical protein KDK70_14955 [Myxococcales bacterium]|nr:hypothetical protein [Myxococcales bacterium]